MPGGEQRRAARVPRRVQRPPARVLAARTGLALGPTLAPPSTASHASFLAALREYRAHGDHRELDVAKLTDPDEFARYVAALRADADEPGALGRYTARLLGVPEPPPPAGGYVPQTVLWWTEDLAFLGRLSIRHRLTPELRQEGNNIGYEVRPSARRRGHATAMLAAALPLAAGLGLEEVRIDCEQGNVASRRVIEKNGGRLDLVENGNCYFVLATS